MPTSISQVVRNPWWPGLRRGFVLSALLAIWLLPPYASAFDSQPVPINGPAPQNTVRDPSFEQTVWQPLNGAGLISPGRTGSAAAQIERKTEKETPVWRGTAAALSPGTWLLSGWLRSWATLGADRNFSAEINVRWLDAGNRELGRSRGLSISGTQPEWGFHEARVIAPTGVESAEIGFSFTGPIVGRVQADDISLIPALEEGVTGGRAPLRVACRPNQSIFAPDDALVVTATLWATDGDSHAVALAAELLDSTGEIVATAEMPSRIPQKSRENIRVTFVTKPSRPIPVGEWLQARLRVHEETVAGPVIGSAECGCLVLPRPVDMTVKPDSPFALLVGHSYAKRWLGARWERPNLVNERLLELPRRYGVLCMPLFDVPHERIDEPGVAEDFRSRVAEYVRTNAKYLDYLQLGNEPALFRPGVTERYVKALWIGWEAAKKEKPSIIISAAGVTGLNVDEDMIAKFLDAGGAQWCDILDIHTYLPLNEMDRIIAKVRRQMAERNVEKPLIITEVTANLGAPISEREKAGHIYKRYAVSLSHRISQIYWFVMHWVNAEPGGFRYCGLIDSANHAPWPAAAAYAALAGELEDLAFVKRDVRDGLWCFEFRGAQRQVLIAWSDAPGQILSLAPAGQLQGDDSVSHMTDINGRRYFLPPNVHTIISLTPEPILVSTRFRDYSLVGAADAQLVTPVDRLTVSRGSEAVVPIFRTEADRPAPFELSGIPQAATCSGVTVVPEAGTGSVRVRVDGAAPLGVSVPMLQGRIGARQYVLRIPVQVTDPLRVSAVPIPTAAGFPALSVTLENSSPVPLGGVLTVGIPVSSASRPAPIKYAFSNLVPGTPASVTIPLSGTVGSLAAYRCDIVAETRGGARASWSRSLVFTPAPRMVSSPTIDGSLSEWEHFPIRIGVDTGARRDAPGSDPALLGDLSAKGVVSWDRNALYLAVSVEDDEHLNRQADGSLWDGDSIQVGLSVVPGVSDTERLEMSVGLGAAGSQAWIHRNFAGKPTGPVGFPVSVIRKGMLTQYEIAIPWSSIPVEAPGPGTWLGVGLLVNESDEGKRGWLGWHHGIATDKNPALFGQVTLVP